MSSQKNSLAPNSQYLTSIASPGNEAKAVKQYSEPVNNPEPNMQTPQVTASSYLSTIINGQQAASPARAHQKMAPMHQIKGNNNNFPLSNQPEAV